MIPSLSTRRYRPIPPRIVGSCRHDRILRHALEASARLLRALAALNWQAAKCVYRLGGFMARKYSEAASKKVEKAMHERKRGTLKSGSSGRKVTSRKQAIAIGLSEARRAGKKVPSRRAASKRRSP
jgi:Family of unknown function (DUF6496)